MFWKIIFTVRGSRKRKEVDYTNSLMDKELLQALQDHGVFDEKDEEDETRRKRRKRTNRKYDSDDYSVVLKTQRRQNINERLKKQMSEIMSAVIKYTNDDGRVLSEPFMKLPSRKSLPDYYKIIKRPVDIKKILQRIDHNKYGDLDDLQKDFIDLCQNARIYNEESCLIHLDSIELQKVFINIRYHLPSIIESIKTNSNSGSISNENRTRVCCMATRTRSSENTLCASSDLIGNEDNSGNAGKKTIIKILKKLQYLLLK